MNISPQQIAYILSLVEHKNFGKAAEACFVTQPTLSMQIKKAEGVLNFKIFNRNRNPLELTTFGEKLLPILYDMQSEFEKIKHLTEIQSGKSTEEFKIGVIPTVSSYLVPKIFEEKNVFEKGHKFVFKELKSIDLLEELQQRKIDFGILAGPVEQENIHQTSLFNEEILIYCPSVKGEKIIQLSELKHLQAWLMNGGNCLRTQMVHFCKLENTEQDKWNYEGGNLEMLINMVNQYGGYTLVPAFYAQKYHPNLKHFHHLTSENENAFPARNIIGVSSLKNMNHPVLKQLINLIKISYSNQELRRFEILNWK